MPLPLSPHVRCHVTGCVCVFGVYVVNDIVAPFVDI